MTRTSSQHPTSLVRRMASAGLVGSAFALTLSAASVAYAACTAPVARASSAPQEESLTVALSALGNESFDPIAGPSFNKLYMQLLFDTIIGSDLKDERISADTGLACSWELSADQRVVTLTLRDGVRFTNGDELTAEDVKFSLERLGSKENIAPFGGTISQAIEKIEAPAKNKVVVTLKSPSYAFIQLLGPVASGTEPMVVSKKYFESVGADRFKAEPMGTGPYKLADRRSGSQMVFEAKEDHFATGRPKFKRVTIRLIPEETTRVAQLRTGQVDLADISREGAQALRQANYQVFTKPAGDVLMLYFQLHKPNSRFADPKIREALSLAINRKELNEFLFKGFGDLSSTFAPKSAVGYKALSIDGFDPDRSRRLLQEAGVKPGDLTIQFQAFSFTGWPETRETANAIASYWDKVGVKTNIIFRDYATYRAEWRDQKLPEPSATLQPQPGIPLPLGLFNAEIKCGAPLPIVCDPKVDELLAKLNSAGNEQEFISSYQAIEQILHDNRYVISLLEAGTVMAGNKKVRTDYSVGKGYLGINLPMVYSSRQ